MIEAVDRLLGAYPESDLADIYKSFFQDEFGPGHLLIHTDEAREYFYRELGAVKSRGRHRAELCGEGRNFCRLPLDLILDGLIERDAYFSAFLSGTEEFRLPSLEFWRSKWEELILLLGSRRDRIGNFTSGIEEISAALTGGEYARHHSPRYRRCYDPHYRIFCVRNDFCKPWL